MGYFRDSFGFVAQFGGKGRRKLYFLGPLVQRPLILYRGFKCSQVSELFVKKLRNDRRLKNPKIRDKCRAVSPPKLWPNGLASRKKS